MRIRVLLPLLSVVLFSACSSAPKRESGGPNSAADQPAAKANFPRTVKEAVNSPYRSAANKLRDKYRHPEETLTFFGVQPNMTVIEISPSAGWYTEILAPYLAENGHYIAASREGSNDEMKMQNEKLAEWMRSFPDVAAHMQAAQFDPSKKLSLAPDNSADMVVTFRNVHNWKGKEAKVFKGFYNALKPGGILGVEEHRAKEKGSSAKGYMKQSEVIKIAQKAGFKLVAKSEVNANSKDTKDYPEGVWTLPPNYALGAQDHDKYETIGESDRMTLKFEKPAAK